MNKEVVEQGTANVEFDPVLKEMKIENSMTVKIRDNYYKFQLSHTYELREPTTKNILKISKEKTDLLNGELDRQVEEVIKAN